MVILNLQKACNNYYNLPKKNQFKVWLNAVIPQFQKKSEVTIRLVDELEIKKLNFLYRGENKPTNVLSFQFKPYVIDSKIPLLGDIIICFQIVKTEAKELQKPMEAYLAHIVIHGSLHLLGFNHKNDIEAKKMQCLETSIMFSLGYENPYS